MASTKINRSYNQSVLEESRGRQINIVINSTNITWDVIKRRVRS